MSFYTPIHSSVVRAVQVPVEKPGTFPHEHLVPYQGQGDSVDQPEQICGACKRRYMEHFWWQANEEVVCPGDFFLTVFGPHGKQEHQVWDQQDFKSHFKPQALSVYRVEDGKTHWFIATSVEEALLLYQEFCEESTSPAGVLQVAPKEVIEVSDERLSEKEMVQRKTAEEWIEHNGYGFLATSAY